MLDHPSYCSLVAVIVWQLSRVQFFAIPWTVAHQAPLSTGDKNTGVDCHFFLQEIFSRDGAWCQPSFQMVPRAGSGVMGPMGWDGLWFKPLAAPPLMK